MKDNTWEAGADVNESGLFSGAGHLEDGGLVSQSPSPRKMDSHLEAHVYLSVEAEVFIMRQKGTELGNQGGDWKVPYKVLYVQMSTVHSDKASDGPVCIILV